VIARSSAVFVSGPKGFFQGLEAGVPLISLKGQQVCQAIKEKAVGLCLESIFEAWEVLEDAARNVGRFQRVMEKKSQEKYDIVYWANYTLNVGLEHLQSEDFEKMGFLTYHDMDV